MDLAVIRIISADIYRGSVPAFCRGGRESVDINGVLVLSDCPFREHAYAARRVHRAAVELR